MAVTIRSHAVQVESGPVPRLLLDFMVRNESKRRVEILMAKAEASAMNLSGPLPTRGALMFQSTGFLGYGAVTHGHGTAGVGYLDPNLQTIWTMTLGVPHHVLDGIENIRRGGDLSLRVSIDYLRLDQDGESPPCHQWECCRDADNHNNACLTVRIAASDWGKLIHQLRAGRPRGWAIALRRVAWGVGETALGEWLHKIVGWP